MLKHVDVIIYHAGCPDGWCAAYLAHQKWPSARLLPMTHGQPIPFEQLKGAHLLVLDFSWKRPECEKLLATVAELQILDHHKTAEQELAGFACATFDMARSGATLTWDTLYGGPRPWVVNYVEDRDLFKNFLQDTQAVNAYIMALPQTPEAWARLMSLNQDYVVLSGRAIRMHVEHYVDQVCRERMIGSLAGHRTAIVNAPYLNIGDVCTALTAFAPIGCGWFERGDGQVQFSLRSTQDVDVSEVAQLYGGGGHKHAAGFQLPYRQGLAVVHAMLGRLSDSDRNALHLDRVAHKERPLTAGVAALLETA